MPTRTKIVATLGPALDPPGVLERTLAAGVDVVRVNLSHGAPGEHAARVARARAAQPDIAVLADLAGPKLRLGDLAQPAEVRAGERVVLGPSGLAVADPDFARRLRAGDPIYIADGAIRLEAVRVAGADVEAVVQVGGILTSRKGIHLPGDDSQPPPLTPKDLRDLDELDAIAPDFVALSYVRHERDLAALRQRTALPIVAKMEKRQAIERMQEIVAAADAVMVARGDLGVEVPIEKVPVLQKQLIRCANRALKPVITATQMLVSMVTQPLPTRAEATDVANAVLDGTDAVMLSEETAVGRDPAGVVHTMDTILNEIERSWPRRLEDERFESRSAEGAIARAAVHLAQDLDAVAILVPTRSGSSARRVAAHRAAIPILAFSPRPETLRRLALVWGVEAFPSLACGEDDVIPVTLAAGRQHLPAGSRVVLVAGWPPETPGNTSFVHTAEL